MKRIKVTLILQDHTDLGIVLLEDSLQEYKIALHHDLSQYLEDSSRGDLALEKIISVEIMKDGE